MVCLAVGRPLSGVQMVHLDNICSTAAPEHSGTGEESCSVGCDSEEGIDTSCSQELLDRIAEGMLIPSVALSDAAARKLQRHVTRSSFYNGHSSICSSDVSHRTPAAGRAACIAAFGPPAIAGETDTRTSDPVLLKSLPTELLYDDAGLQLFDQITYLPEYYLTAAEADILSHFGPDIVRECVRDGASVVELGAGSMRKTKLLLDAVVAADTQDVTFFALDLCEESLSQALRQLQDHFGNQIRLAGLVGTYQQGLAYIQQQQQQTPGGNGSSSISRSTSSTTFFVSEPAMTNLAAPAAAAATAADNTWSPAANAGAEGVCNSSSSSKQLAPAGPEDQTDGGSETVLRSSDRQDSDGDVTADDSSIEQDSFDGKTVSGDSTLSSDDVAVLLNDLDVASNNGSSSGTADCTGDCMTEPERSAGCQQGTRGSTGSGSGSSGPGKLIMWLGSSIGNYSREAAVSFLTQLRELAMQPGDLLLVGIDRRNNPDKVAKAYNDAAGVTNAFIMNGLQHCKHILDAELHNTSTHKFPETTDRMACNQGMVHVGSEASSIQPEDFEYFCLYNDELGRHEAYYLATRDAQISFPAKAGSPKLSRGVGCAAAVAGSEVCTVGIAAGELIHIEFSHKYSQQEVEELAAKAGLKWVKAWTDSQQQYDLHLFSRGDGPN